MSSHDFAGQDSRYKDHVISETTKFKSFGCIWSHHFKKKSETNDEYERCLLRHKLHVQFLNKDMV